METCSCIILSVLPWRESSAIVNLFSRAHGRVGGIARGIRRPPLKTGPLERGQIVDLVLYYRPHRELHTMSQVSVANGFAATRTDLGKIAVRDAALEIILKTLGADEAHPELFDYTAAFLSRIDGAPGGSTPFGELWRFICGWSAFAGFKINLETCLRCGSGSVLDDGGRLAPEQDGVICGRCLQSNGNGRLFIPGAVLRQVAGEAGNRPSREAAAPGEQLRITTLFVDYARYHFDIRGDLKTIAFLAHLVAMQHREGKRTVTAATTAASTP